MAISALPSPPQTSDPTTFAAKADAFIAALPTFVTEANALQTDVNNKQALVTSVADVAQRALDSGLADAQANAETAAAASDAATAAWTAALAANPDLNPVLRMNPNAIVADTAIPADYNAYSAGPIEITEGATVTINDNGRWTII